MKNGFKVHCQDCKHLNKCLENELIAKQDAEPFLYNSLLTHIWQNEGNFCIFESNQEYKNS